MPDSVKSTVHDRSGDGERLGDRAEVSLSDCASAVDGLRSEPPGKSAPRAARLSLWCRRVQRSAVSGQGGLAALALVVGAGAGLGAVTFRYMIFGVTYLFTGHDDYSAAGHAINPLVPGLGIWFVVLVPVIGGFIYRPLVSRFAPEARGHGVPGPCSASCFACPSPS